MIGHNSHQSGNLGSQKPSIMLELVFDVLPIVSHARGIIAFFHLLSIVWVLLFGFFIYVGSRINYYFLHNFVMYFLIIIS